MTKTLTEQWKDGTLKGGIYYLLLRDGTTATDETVYIGGEKQLRWYHSSFDFVKEVLAHVPSYDEYNDLKEDNKYSKSGIETRDKQIEALQERLADADKTINFYDSKDFHYTLPDGTVMGKEPAHQYKLKWKV